jgi:hypothetical protein
MTPQERQLVSDLFDKLARLETTPRDADAERAIAEGLQRAPHAIYPLVQTVLLQDEALRRADARIRELEGEPEGALQNGGFLDQMRDALFGGRSGGTSVPSVRQNLGGDSRWREPTQNATPAPNGIGAGIGGGSFLGTAAASAVGVVGGMMMANMIGSLLGGGAHGQAFAGQPQMSEAIAAARRVTPVCSTATMTTTMTTARRTMTATMPTSTAISAAIFRGALKRSLLSFRGTPSA